MKLKLIPTPRLEISHLNIDVQGTHEKEHQMDKLNLAFDTSVRFYDTGFSDEIGLEIKLERLALRGIIENIIPPALLVIVSWVENFLNAILNYIKSQDKYLSKITGEFSDTK